MSSSSSPGTDVISDPAAAAALRAARVGDLLTGDLVRGAKVRVLDATAFVVPGTSRPQRYLAALEARRDDFAAWDGRLVALAPDGAPAHRVTIVDRYGQVYDTADAVDEHDLPGPAALEEWFRFLATACPECGVIDDPTARGFGV